MARATMAQGHELQKLLSSYSVDQVQRMLDSPHLLRALVEADLTKVDSRRFNQALEPFDPNSVFTSPSDQTEMIRDRLHRCPTPLQQRQIDEACEALPNNPGEGLECYTFRLWLLDLQITYSYLWAWFCDVYNLELQDRWFDPRPAHARSLHPRSYDGANDLTVVCLDLDAYWGPLSGSRHAPASVRNSMSSAGLELLMAAIMHPEWFKRTGSRLIPGVWMPGIELNPRAVTNPWSDAPLMSWMGDERPFLGRANMRDVRSGYAIPTITTWVL